ncbi:MAG TPA: polysaccharide deacetylase family protein [Candidatus Hydrothermia bacterium]|nr:polysaccharide deacetylase family protein [Candidatus Hydrothermia bacterium]HOP32487.1 polysaccharide deacetylase family protein [Candidatus Hydrothermia bacterium]
MQLLLQYHHISKGIEFNPNICPLSLFKKHLSELNHLGFSDLTHNFEKEFGKTSEISRVLITFDDGYKSIVKNAYPLMEQYGYKGIVFIVTGFLGKESLWEVPFLTPLPHLDEDDIKLLHTMGWIIGSHSHMHRDLTGLTDRQLREEIGTSQKILEDIIGNKITYFSYPYGKYNQRVVSILKELGFIFAFKSSEFPKKYTSQINMLQIPRRTVYIIDITLKYKIDPFYTRFETMKEVVSNKMAFLSPIYAKLLEAHKGNPCDNNRTDHLGKS